MSAGTNVGNLSVGIEIAAEQLQAGLDSAVKAAESAGQKMKAALEGASGSAGPVSPVDTSQLQADLDRAVSLSEKAGVDMKDAIRPITPEVADEKLKVDLDSAVDAAKRANEKLDKTIKPVKVDVNIIELQNGLDRAVQATIEAGKKMHASIGTAGGQTVAISGNANRGGFGGMGGFAQTVGRIADDAQYGFRGIVNNLEQLGQSAGSVFGLASKDAMALGAVMTLLGVAVNQASDELVKFTDGRTEFEKLADGVTAYSGSLNVAEAAVKALAEETAAAGKSDATVGAAAFFGRLGNWMMTPHNDVDGRYGRLFKPTQAQLDANKASGEKVQRGQMDMALMSGKLQRDRGGVSAGIGLLDRGRNATDVESNKDAAKVFAEAIHGKEELSSILLQKQLQADGMKPMQSEIESLKLLGFASEGVVAAFENVAKRLPELKLAENLAGINTAKDTETNMANLADQFRDDQKKAEEIAKADEAKRKELSGLEDKSSTIRGRISDLMDQRARSEIVGSSDVFSRNLNSGQADPVVTAIEKQTEELKTLTREIATLG